MLYAFRTVSQLATRGLSTQAPIVISKSRFEELEAIGREIAYLRQYASKLETSKPEAATSLRLTASEKLSGITHPSELEVVNKGYCESMYPSSISNTTVTKPR